MATVNAHPVTAEQRARQRIRALLGKRYKPGQRLPPIKTLAKKLGLGQTNTQRAVQQLMAEGLLLARPSLGTVVCDGVEAIDPLPTFGIAGRNIGIVCGNLEPLLSHFAQLFRRAIARAGARCQFESASEDFPACVARVIDSDLLILINPPMDEAFTQQYRPAMLLISTAAELDIDPALTCDFISANSRHGGWMAGRHFRDVGVTDCCFIGRTGASRHGYDQTSAERLAGCEAGFGRALSTRHRIHTENYTPITGAKAAAEYAQLAHRPAGVFCASDDLAVGFVMGAHALGLEPARDYQLIGFDGQMRGRELIGGPLTTIEIPIHEMAALGMQWINERFLQPNRPNLRLQMNCKLFQGATTRRQF